MKTISTTLLITLLAFASGCSTPLTDRAVGMPGIGGEIDAKSSAAAPSSCVVTGKPRTVAPKARIVPAMDIVSDSDKLVLGLSTGRDEAVRVDLDPRSATAMHRTVYKPSPMRGKPDEQRLDVTTFDCKNQLDNARSIAADSPFAIGTRQGWLAWSSCSESEPQPLWKLPAGPVQDLQGLVKGRNAGFVIIFRQNDTLWMGALDADKKPVGSLSKVAERSHLRWPTLAESGGALLMAWAEQKPGSERLSLGGTTIAKDGAAKTVEFDLPLGGLGGEAFQPALVGLDGDRFLMVWTEGHTWTNEVRAATFRAGGEMIGSVLPVSATAEGGWGRPAVTADGRGVVVFLTPTDVGFALAATPIACPITSDKTARIAVSRR